LPSGKIAGNTRAFQVDTRALLGGGIVVREVNVFDLCILYRQLKIIIRRLLVPAIRFKDVVVRPPVLIDKNVERATSDDYLFHLNAAPKKAKQAEPKQYFPRLQQIAPKSIFHLYSLQIDSRLRKGANQRKPRLLHAQLGAHLGA